jgi:type II secretory pathway component PulK
MNGHGSDRKATRGVSLLPSLMVVAVIVLIAACVLNYTRRSAEQRLQSTYSGIAHVCRAVRAFETARGKLPDALEELTVPVSGSAERLQPAELRDAWGRPFRYTRTVKPKFEVRSAGPDGKMDTMDDLTNPGWERQ